MAAPPPPLSSTPTPLSTPDSTGVHQVLPAPPSPQDEFSPKIEEARARAAIEAVQKKYLDYYGPRYQADAIQITLDGAWARGVTLWKIDSKAFDETFTILAHRQLDGNWQAMMPGSDGLYLQWLDAAPESLIPAASKSQLRAQANEAASLQSPQTTPMVPLPVTSAEESNGQVEQQVLAQPTATPTAMPSVIVTLPSGWPSKPVGPLPTPVSGVIPLIILGNDDESGPASSELLIQQEVANASASCSDADSFQFPVGGANDHSGWNRTTQFGGTTVLGPGHLGEDYDWASGDETGKPVVATANGKVFYATGQTQ